MTRFTLRAVAFAVVAVLAATLLAAGGGAAATGQFPAVSQIDAGETTTNETTAEGTATDSSDANATVEPGAMLAGVVGVQEAEVDSEVENRTYGLRIAGAATDAARAEIVAERLTEAKRELADQQRTLAALRDARANGTITEGAYRAQVATIASQTANTKRAAEQLNRTASDLPAAVRERNGINASAIERLWAEAGELSGPETAAIARSIAGTRARNPMAGGPSARGPFGPRNAVPGGQGEGRPGAGAPGADAQRPGGQNAAGTNGQPATQASGNSEQGTDDSASGAETGNSGPKDLNSGESVSSGNSGESPGNSGGSASTSGGNAP